MNKQKYIYMVPKNNAERYYLRTDINQICYIMQITDYDHETKSFKYNSCVLDDKNQMHELNKNRWIDIGTLIHETKIGGMQIFTAPDLETVLESCWDSWENYKQISECNY